MRLATTNLWNGGGRRIEALSAHIARTDADIHVLSEYRQGIPASTRLNAQLSDLGYTIHCNWQGTNQNTVAIAARGPVRHIETDPAWTRWIVDVDVGGLRVTGLYAPQPRPATGFHSRFVDHLIGSEGPRVVIGDWNAGLHFVDEASNSMSEHDAILRLHQAGLAECWLFRHGITAPEHTWFSPQRQNGFRIDQAFVSADLIHAIRSADYDHDIRHQGLSDHSSLSISLDLLAPARRSD